MIINHVIAIKFQNISFLNLSPLSIFRIICVHLIFVFTWWKKKKTKIFFFNPYPAIGGVNTVIKKFINSLDLRYYNVEYLTLKKCKYKFNEDITFTNLNRNSVLLSYLKIIRLLLKDKNEKKIFFSLQYFTNIWTVLFLKRIKQVKIFLYEVNHLDELNNYKNPVEFIKKKYN